MTDLEDYLRRQNAMIDKYGWAVTIVLPTADDPPTTAVFGYTVGLTAHGHPELIIAGLDPAICHALLNDLARRVYDTAETFNHGQRITDLIIGYDAIIVNGDATEHLLPGAAFGRYGKQSVRLQQIVWPDINGRFPWEHDYVYPPHVQPTIGRP
jgi:hypothetical protein